MNEFNQSANTLVINKCMYIINNITIKSKSMFVYYTMDCHYRIDDHFWNHSAHFLVKKMMA